MVNQLECRAFKDESRREHVQVKKKYMNLCTKIESSTQP